MIFFMKSSKFLPKYHLNLFPKSQFSSYINPCLVILFWEVQNQNKQKGTSRCLYQNKNKRPHFLTQKSDSWQKQIWKYCNISWKTVKTCHTFIYWEPNNKLARCCVILHRNKFIPSIFPVQPSTTNENNVGTMQVSTIQDREQKC